MSAPAPDSADALASLGIAPQRAWWRRRSTWIGALLALGAVAGGIGWYAAVQRGAPPSYVTQPVTRGDLSLTVVANGTLAPTRTVSIGSELSGTVARVLVDVNDRVTKGQVLVELDKAKFEDQVKRSTAALAVAQANVATTAATVRESEASLQRLLEVQKLSGGKMPAQTEIDTAEAALQRARASVDSARANVKDAQAALATDQTNLQKASIRSPIDGVILTRSVDPGNAVAASLQAVTLFTIAESLERMRLEIKVDEADVGSVQVGQRAEFTVSSWPNRHFPATISRVAYGSTTTDNVVSYVTYLDVDNAEQLLRPGMTATATIRTSERNDVVLVPNAALRFRPTQAAEPAALQGAPADGAQPNGGDAVASAKGSGRRDRSGGDGKAGPAGTGGPPAGGAGGGVRSGESGSAGSTALSSGPTGIMASLMPRPPRIQQTRRASTGGEPLRPGGERTLYVLKDGALQPVRVTVGLSDGRMTEVTAGPLQEGMAVVTDQRSAG